MPRTLNNLVTRAAAKLLRKIRVVRWNRLIDDGGGRIVLMDPWMRVSIYKSPTARLVVGGHLVLYPHMGGNSRTTISLGDHATLRIDGDFEIGDGVRIGLEPGANLQIGGRQAETVSGITSDTTILVRRKVTIGKDFICAWNVFISDSHWHEIQGQRNQEDVVIGDHVWVAHGASVLKGAQIAEGSVVACHSVVTSRGTPSNSLLAGTPARVVKTGVVWRRDLQGPA